MAAGGVSVSETSSLLLLLFLECVGDRLDADKSVGFMRSFPLHCGVGLSVVI